MRDGGAFYRFTPQTSPDLSAGTLEIAVVGSGGKVTWARALPQGGAVPARKQVPGATVFNRAELRIVASAA